MRTGLCRECRGRGRPRKLHKDGPSPSPSTGGIIKRGRGRPRKEEQQSEATMPPPTPPASSRWGFKLGCGRPMLAPTTGHDAEAGDAMPAETGGAALAGIKRETTWEGGQERRSQQQQCLLKLGMLRRPGSREGVGGQERRSLILHRRGSRGA